MDQLVALLYLSGVRGLLLTFFITLIVSVLLFLYACEVGYFLYLKSGGIRFEGRWTQYGGAPHAWTIPIQLPGGLIAVHANSRLGVFIMSGGLALSAYAIASVFVAMLERQASVLGAYKWKAVLIVLGVIWVPVPETVAWIYQFTVTF